jgi:hypothetical protein
VRPIARTVADFLGVPVLDRGGAAGADPMAKPAEFWAVASPVVSEPEPDVLLIRPRRLAVVAGIPWWGLVLAFVLLGSLADWRAGNKLPFVMAGAIGLSALLQLLSSLVNLRRTRLDRARGELTLGWLRLREVRPLADVKAVEVVEDEKLQLNLLPHDPQKPRLTLVADADAALVRRVAERVSSFLGVPLLDARRTAPASAQPANLLEELSRSPLPPGKASIRGPACIVAKGDDVLVLRGRSRLTWIGLLPTLFTVGVGVFLIWQVVQAGPAGQVGFQQWGVWLMIFVLGPLAQVATLKPMLWYRDHFDRLAGLLRLGLFGVKGTYSLAKVLAVQLVPGGLVHKPPGPFGRGGERVSYQLNLVMADVYQDRLNLTDDTDLQWTRQAGQQIAEFLGVPLLDQIAEGD